VSLWYQDELPSSQARRNGVVQVVQTETAQDIRKIAEEKPDVMINARGVSRTYETGRILVHALRDVDFTVHRGEMVAIMGPSGCGKTTLLNCLSGLDTVDTGTVEIAGTELSTMSDNDRTDFRAAEMGFIFQFYNLLPVLSAVENVELPLLVAGVPISEARKRAMAMLAQTGIGHQHMHYRPSALSGGQRQRVTIARALVNKPAIVWADEPTGDLDSKSAGEIMDLLRQLNREHQETFVVVTHDPEIGALCDRIVLMRDGRIVDESAGGITSENGRER
jgi:putative ABC transport system ATP-binding protein